MKSAHNPLYIIAYFEPKNTNLEKKIASSALLLFREGFESQKK